MDQRTVLPEFLTISEASHRTGVGEAVIRSAISRGDLPVFQPCANKGGTRYIEIADLQAWLGQHRDSSTRATGEATR